MQLWHLTFQPQRFSTRCFMALHVLQGIHQNASMVPQGLYAGSQGTSKADTKQ
jgi:hypothetical protein